MIEPADKQIPIRRQCELLGLHRSTLYYQPRGEDAFNERLMRLIDEQYVRTPFYGVEQMRLHLNRVLAPQRVKINAKRVRRLMRLMGLEAIYPKRRLSVPNKAHRVYPYLLKDLTIDQPDQVWATDITYIPMRRGWVYLVAIMDWFSRYVLAWEVSTTLDASFCVDALKRALSLGTPEIFNSDQGSQFTSEAFTVRELRYQVRRPGFRTTTVTLVTTLLGPRKYPKEELAELYGTRWTIETNLRHLKQTMGMGVLRSKSVDGVKKELLAYAIAYNLVRLRMLEEASRRGVEPDRVSFIEALDALCYGARTPLRINAHRPGRDEPRVIKRRKDRYTVMTKPRDQLRQDLGIARHAA